MIEAEHTSANNFERSDWDIQRLALRPKEAAKALGLGTRKLWELTNRGLVPHVRLDKAILYPVDGLREWLAKQSNGAGNKPAKRI